MKLIVAVSRSWAIGKDNKLLFSLKEDMKFFKATTLNKVVVMGGNTYLSLPKRPLKDRVNIVLSSRPLEGCIRVTSLSELFKTISEYNTDDVFVIGGTSMYKTLLPYCTEALITKVDADAEADAYFPNLDNDENWQCVKALEAQDTYKITFCTYKNNNVTEYKI